MASNNNYYYDDGQRPNHGQSYTPSPDPFYNPHSAYTSQQPPTHAPYQGEYSSSPAPSYRQATYSQGQHDQKAVGPSPFATVFDDNYAAGSTSSLPQHGVYQDSSYHGHNHGVGASGSNLNSSSTPHVAGDIPLQDHPGKDGDMTDHIYDASGAAQDGSGRKKKKRVRVGELGMLGSDKKRIPWVCYVLTAVQVGVFIGEIVRNGKCSGVNARVDFGSLLMKHAVV